MKRVVVGVLSILLIAMLVKYFVSSYDIKYSINDIEVHEKYKSGNYYFELKKDITYNFDISMSRKITKSVINRIEVIENSDEVCLLPIIKGTKTYPVCSKDGKQTSYYYMETNELKDFIASLNIEEKTENTNETFKFYNNLTDDEFIAVYNYRGFYILNGNKIKTVNIFNSDRYDNTLCEQVDNYLIFPEESEFNFRNFIVLDLKTAKYTIIKSRYDISFDSIMLGHIKRKVYILDQKNGKEYEINLRKKEVEEIGNYEQGFKVYKDGKFKTALISEVKDSVPFNINKSKSLYEYLIKDNSLYKINKNNKELKTLIYKGNVEIKNEKDNSLIFLDGNTLYKYNPLFGLKRILVNDELKYSKINTIYIYNNN